jgi:putative hemolysin
MNDLAACQRLRYLVFNCELGEGLADSDHSGLDRDPFDLICDHLMVHDAATNHLVGTYRMQTVTAQKAISAITPNNYSTSLHSSRCAARF